MAFSQRITGKDLYVGFIDGSGTVNLSGDRRSLDVNDSMDTVDASAGNDTARGFKKTLRVLGASLTLLNIGTAGSADYARVQPGDEGTLLWGPEGTATGKTKGAFPAIVKAFNQTFPYDGVVEITVEFEPQGDYSSNPASATW